MTHYELFTQLHGEQLSSVEFVHDYVQLWFDGPGINVMSQIVVISEDGECRSGEIQFRNALCDQIGKTVKSVTVVMQESLDIDFKDGSRISLSLRSDAYDGPEAVYYHGFKDGEWGVI